MLDDISDLNFQIMEYRLSFAEYRRDDKCNENHRQKKQIKKSPISHIYILSLHKRKII